MKIIYVITRADTLAGAQVHVAELSRAMREQGHEVLVICGSGRPLVERLQAEGTPVRQLPQLERSIRPLADARVARELVEIFRDLRPDLVSAHSSKTGILARRAARRCGIPCLFTAHGWAFTPGVPLLARTLYRGLEKHHAPLAARIICVSEGDRELGLAAGMDPDRLITIHNGRPDIPDEFLASPGGGGPVRFAMVGRLDRQKDHPLLFRAVAAMPEASRPELHLIGDGPNEGVYRELARSLGIADRVLFHGLLADVAPVLATMHGFVLASHWEGFPRSTLEAMRAGLPVIVSDVGGSAEAVVEGETGFVVPAEDEDALRQRLEQLVGDGALRTRLGEAGRQRFLANYRFEDMVEATHRVYEVILGE